VVGEMEIQEDRHGGGLSIVGARFRLNTEQ
jgi:hypothetical protein